MPNPVSPLFVFSDSAVIMVQVNPDLDLRLPGPKPVNWRINSAGGIEIDRSVGRSVGSVGEHKSQQEQAGAAQQGKQCTPGATSPQGDTV